MKFSFQVTRRLYFVERFLVSARFVENWGNILTYFLKSIFKKFWESAATLSSGLLA
jgi:hypothetical protein